MTTTCFPASRYRWTCSAWRCALLQLEDKVDFTWPVKGDICTSVFKAILSRNASRVFDRQVEAEAPDDLAPDSALIEGSGQGTLKKRLTTLLLRPGVSIDPKQVRE